MKSRAIISLALAAVCLVTSMTFASAAAKKGDIDGDKSITVTDARLVLRAAIGMHEGLTDAQYNSCDFNMDGLVGVEDARLVLRVAIGLPPVEGEENLTGKALFDKTLYDHAHACLGTTMNHYYVKAYQKWCTVYTIGDVLRPVLQKCGYSQDAINKLAPNNYPQDLWDKLLTKNAGALVGTLWSRTAAQLENIYTPSMLMGYYQQHEADGLCKIFNFVTYYDDEIEQSLVYENEIEKEVYEPEIGDILFITNKTMFQSAKNLPADATRYSYNTIIHTAQIIGLNDDGTFLTTEGAIIEPSEGDGVARVRERTYFWNDDIVTNRDGYGNLLNVPEYHYSTWQFRYNSTVIVLAAVRPDWSIQ